jgi:TonB family protein
MGLRARRQNGDLELTWNRESSLVTAATSGVLSIEDGDVRLQIPLDLAQVRGGSVLYAPTTDRIQMQLTVTTPDHAVTESVMVLIPKVGAPRIQPLDPVPQLPSEGIIPRPKPAKSFIAPSTSQHAAMPAPMLAPDAPPVATAISSPDPAVIPLAVSQTPPAPPPRADSESQPPPSAAAAPPAQPASGMTPDFRPPLALNQISPRLPADLRWIAVKPVVIAIRVTIDKQGKVAKAEPISAKGINGFLVNEAVRAARSWRFQPAQRGGAPVESEMVLQFVFKQ